jgi:hypothetical protein
VRRVFVPPMPSFEVNWEQDDGCGWVHPGAMPKTPEEMPVFRDTPMPILTPEPLAWYRRWWAWICGWFQ